MIAKSKNLNGDYTFKSIEWVVDNFIENIDYNIHIYLNDAIIYNIKYNKTL